MNEMEERFRALWDTAERTIGRAYLDFVHVPRSDRLVQLADKIDALIDGCVLQDPHKKELETVFNTLHALDRGEPVEDNAIPACIRILESLLTDLREQGRIRT